MSVPRTASAAMQVDDFAQAIEIIPGKLNFVWIRRPEAHKTSPIAAANVIFSIDSELLYEPFFADFGPLNLGRAYRFCQKSNQLLQEAERQNKQLYYYTGPSAQHKANAAVLVGIYQVVFLGRTAEEAFKLLLPYKPFLPFRDASCGVSTFHLTVFDCIKGVEKAKSVGFVDWHLPKSTFDIAEYEHYEQVENGDLNWIVPGKFLGFSGPAAKSIDYGGYRTPVPEDYWEYFRSRNVVAVVRLNKKVYDRRRFVDGGFAHYDLYFPDGSCPADPVLKKFLDVADKELQRGAIAVHCKAGLGRTGVMICCWLMKHYRFTAEEVIGWIRICRPGSVIGPQQHYIRDMQARMWAEADAERSDRDRPKGNSWSPRGAADLIGARASSHTDSEANSRRAGSGSDVGVLLSNDLIGTANGMKHYVGAGVNGSPRAPAAGVRRSSTPTRYGAPVPAPPSYARGGGFLASGTTVLSTRGTQPVAAGSGVAGTGRTMPQAGRSQSADRAAPRMAVSEPVTPVMNGSSAAAGQLPYSSLRSTVDAFPTGAFARPRVLPERYAQSMPEPPSNAWRLNAPSPGNGILVNGQSKMTSAANSANGSLTSNAGRSPSPGGQATVARVLAPNGQPRKVPMALLMHQSNGAGGSVHAGRAPSPRDLSAPRSASHHSFKPVFRY